MNSLFGLGSTAQINISFDDEDNKKLVEVKTAKDHKEKLPLFFDGETVSGKVEIKLTNGKKLEHQGIKVELFGDIEFFL